MFTSDAPAGEVRDKGLLELSSKLFPLLFDCFAASGSLGVVCAFFNLK
jgi:hypothetical protein